MKDNVILVNCARGGIVNESDLYEALKEGKVFAAGVDVFEKEPAGSNKLLELENVFATPHIGANTKEGQNAVAVIIAEQVYNALHGKPYQNAVNIPFMKSQLPWRCSSISISWKKWGSLLPSSPKGGPQRSGSSWWGRTSKRTCASASSTCPSATSPSPSRASRVFSMSVQGDDYFHQRPLPQKDRNIAVEESKTDQFDKFNDLVLVQVKRTRRRRPSRALSLRTDSGRIVLYDKFRLDIMPEGTFLHFRIIDRPGIIGKVGTILGSNAINIAGFGLSRQTTGEEAAFVSVDSPISSEVLGQIRAIDGMIEAVLIQL